MENNKKIEELINKLKTSNYLEILDKSILGDIENDFNNYLENMEVPNIKSKTFTGWLKELDSSKIKKNAEFQYKNIKMKILSIEAGNPTNIELTFTSNYVYDI